MKATLSTQATTYPLDQIRFRVDAGLANTLTSLAREEDVPLYTVLLTAYQVLLGRHCQTADIDVLLCVASMHQHPGIGTVISYKIDGTTSFRKLLSNVHAAIQSLSAQRDTTYDDTKPSTKCLQGLGDPHAAGFPHFTAVFTLDGEAIPVGVKDSCYVVSGQTPASTGCDLELRLSFPDTNKLEGRILFREDLFAPDTICRFASNFQTLLAGVAKAPDTPAALLPIISQEESDVVLYEWNKTDAPWPTDKCIHHLFEAQAGATPSRTALIDGERHITYGELFLEVQKLAALLLSLGVGSDIPVALLIERSTETVIAIYSVLRAGGFYVPIETEWPAERIVTIMADATPPVLLTRTKHIPKIPENYGGVVLSMDALPQHTATHLQPKQPPTPSSAVYCFYTSGTSGKPKGVVVEHRGLVKRIQWLQDQYPLAPDDRMLNNTSYGFGISEWEYFWALPHGATLVIAAPERQKDPEYLQSLMVQERIGFCFFVPSMLNMLLKYMTLNTLNDSTFITHMFTCGEALMPKTCSQFFTMFDARLINLYGPTEADMTYWECPRLEPGEIIEKIPIGKPVSNVKVYILDEHMQPVPVGVPGELHFGGANTARGYLNRPALTSMSFIQNPFANGLLYKTGDMVQWLPDGNIEFLGRVDHQVKIRGFRIEMDEIETVLSQHSAIQDTVVIAREDVPGNKRLVAYVCFAQDQTPSISELRTLLKQKLPDYMIPSAFVTLDRLPLTPNGKVDRRALPAPDSVRPDLATAFVAPRTPEEETVAKVWAEFLNIDQVGVHDNFFELGGHSLLATQIISRLSQTFQMDLPLRTLFEKPTTTDLAKSIKQARQTAQKRQTPPIERRIQTENLPLSFTQQRLWFIDRLQPGNLSYNISSAYRLTGLLNTTALEQAVNEIVRRHESLRTTFSIVDGEPIQIIAPTLTLALPVIDLSDLPATEREAQTQQGITRESRWEFDLAQGPLLRISLLYLGEKEHILVLTVHHSVFDGWSLDVLLHELSTLYEAFSAKKPSPLAEMPLQYADFAIWQRKWLQGEVLEKQLVYWKKQLDGVPPVLELLGDHPRPTIQSFRGAKQYFTLSQTLSQALNKLSKQARVTLFMTLLAAFKVLLYRYTGQKDIVVGSPIASRNRAEIEDLIGFFANTLILRTDLSGTLTFYELLKQIQKMALDAYDHQELPVDKIVEALQPKRVLNYNPLFQVMFVFENVSRHTLNFPGLMMNPLKVDNRAAMFDLSLYIYEEEEGMQCVLEYNTDLFEAATIERMIGHFHTLLVNIVDKPDIPISQLSLLTKVERHQLLVAWNDTQADYPKDKCIHQLFEAQVKRTPEAIAAVFEGQQLTYRELDSQSNQLTHYLTKHNVGPGTLIGICMERSLEMLIGLLGILKAGGAFVPLDPAYPQERLVFMLTDTQAQILLTQSHLTARFAKIENLQPICLDTDWDTITQESEANPVTEITANNLAYVIYTSGSTGTPKGVAGLHQGAINRFSWMWKAYTFEPQEICCQKTSLSFVDSIWEIFGPLLQGIQTVIIPDEVLKDLPQLVQILAAHRVTRMVLVPSLLRVILDAYTDLKSRLPHLKIWVTSGEALSIELAQHFQGSMPQSVLINLYGSSEVSADSTWYDTKKGQSLSCIPIGRPIANTQAYILDSYLQPVPIGVPGELHIGGDGLARGYLNRPALTSEKFISNSFNTGHLYKTGDLARYLPDGNIEFLGRIDNQVQIRGFRIEPGEIERALNQHPAIQETVVTVGKDVSGDKRLVAYVCFAQDQTLSISELRTLLKKLPNYMAISAFVILEALPLTPNGKIDRQALPTPDASRPKLKETLANPRTPIEEKLADIWGRILSVEQVGIHDNFFDLGGHSLMAVRLFAQIEKTFDRNLPLATLFQTPTIEQLAHILHQKDAKPSWSSLVPLQSKGTRPAFFFVHAHGGNVIDYYELARHLGPDQPFYGLQAQGLDGASSPFCRFEDMAAHYIKEIRAVQPHGPYYIGGWCLGGYVALEMARHLQAEDEEVALVVMVENPHPDYPKYLPGTGALRRHFYRVIARLDLETSNFLEVESGKRFAFTSKRSSRLVNNVRVKFTRTAHAPGETSPANNSVWQVQKAVEQAHTEAYWSYRPQPYEGAVAVIRTAKQPLGIYSDPTLGWGKLITSGLDIQEEVPGHRIGSLDEPRVRIMADKIEKCLDKAQQSKVTL